MSDSLGILVEAKKEYTNQLCILMCPVMIGVFQDMYEEAVRMSKNKKPLLQYQRLLKEVPNWSNAMSKKHEDNIVNRCTWFSDLLAAVFVSHVKILSSVRLKSDSKRSPSSSRTTVCSSRRATTTARAHCTTTRTCTTTR